MATESDSTNRAAAQSQNLQPTHTQGPWDCDVAGQPIIINGPDDSEGRNVICTIEDADCMHGQHQYPPEVAAANARLIAVSPELLSVSQKAYAWLTGMSFTPACKADAENLIAEFSSVIAKATVGRALTSEQDKSNPPPWKPQKYRLKNDYPQWGWKAGLIVYDCKGWDYGCANDDTRNFGVEHTSVSLKDNGDYPFNTVPKHLLEPVP